MTANRLLIDSSFLFALYNQSDDYHQQAQRFAAGNQSSFLIPDVILPEVTFLFSRRGGVPAVGGFLRTLAAVQPHLEPLTITDIQHASEIMSKYADSKLDFVDCGIMAMAERLNIIQICTFDRRDFGIYRPTHCEHLELLP